MSARGCPSFSYTFFSFARPDLTGGIGSGWAEHVRSARSRPIFLFREWSGPGCPITRIGHGRAWSPAIREMQVLRHPRRRRRLVGPVYAVDVFIEPRASRFGDTLASHRLSSALSRRSASSCGGKSNTRCDNFGPVPARGGCLQSTRTRTRVPGRTREKPARPTSSAQGRPSRPRTRALGASTINFLIAAWFHRTKSAGYACARHGL